jgi:hypothetical protein
MSFVLMEKIIKNHIIESKKLEQRYIWDKLETLDPMQ